MEAASPFDGRVQQDRIKVRFADGRAIEGSYLPQAGMHFVHCKDGSAMGRVEGPINPGEVAGVDVLTSRDEIMAERAERRRGDPVPGRLLRTREGYESRLDTLARAASLAQGFRREQIIHQFDVVADEIGLAKTKRNWLLAIARWRLHSNRDPTKMDFCGGDLTQAEKYQRPRPQDFDPNPKIRRSRPPLPAEIAADPKSVPNMVKALRRAGFNARPSVLGETTLEEADLLVDFPGGKAKGRFALLGRRNPQGEMVWRSMWDGNGSKADQTRRQRAFAGEAYKAFQAVVAAGLVKEPGPVPAGSQKDSEAAEGLPKLTA